MSRARAIVGWVWKATAVVGLTGLLVASVGKLHASELDAVHLADVSSDGLPLLGSDAPLALAIEGDALVFLGSPDRPRPDPKTGRALGAMRVARRSDVGRSRRTSSRELAVLSTSSWYAYPEVAVSRAAYAVTFRDAPPSNYDETTGGPGFARIDKTSGHLDGDDALVGAFHLRTVGFGDGFVTTFVTTADDGRTGAFHALVFPDGERARAHVDLERTVAELLGDAIATAESPIENLVAVGGQIVVDVKEALDPTATPPARHRLFVFPARGGARRELAEMKLSASQGDVKLLAGSRDGVWLETTRRLDRSSASTERVVERTLWLLPLREGAAPTEVHRLSLTEDDAMRLVAFPAGDDLVSTTCDAPQCPGRALVRLRPDGSTESISLPTALARLHRVLAADEREAYAVVAGDEVFRLRLR